MAGRSYYLTHLLTYICQRRIASIERLPDRCELRLSLPRLNRLEDYLQKRATRPDAYGSFPVREATGEDRLDRVGVVA